MDQTLLKLQQDKKLKALEKQVEYFRSQALRLKSEREGKTILTQEFVQKIAILKEKLDACQLEKKYFETFMIESRKDNKELKERVIKGERETLDKIKEFAKQESRKPTLIIQSQPDSERDKPKNNTSVMKQAVDSSGLKSNLLSPNPKGITTFQNLNKTGDLQSRFLGSMQFDK